jgi:hypothetical protein
MKVVPVHCSTVGKWGGEVVGHIAPSGAEHATLLVYSSVPRVGVLILR